MTTATGGTVTTATTKTMFLVHGWRWGTGKIEPIAVTKETPKQVTYFVYGDRDGVSVTVKKQSAYNCVFATWQEAHDWLLQHRQSALKYARDVAAQQERYLAEVVALQPPEAS